LHPCDFAFASEPCALVAAIPRGFSEHLQTISDFSRVLKSLERIVGGIVGRQRVIRIGVFFIFVHSF
jgi:hypothetical protein